MGVELGEGLVDGFVVGAGDAVLDVVLVLLDVADGYEPVYVPVGRSGGAQASV